MKFIISILFLIFITINTNASCAGEVLNVYPNNNSISENPVILIEWMEKDYDVYDNINYLKFYLLNESGVKTELIILDQLYNTGTYAQILLQPKFGLPKSKEVSLVVEPGIQVEEYHLEKFIRRIEYERSWEIKKYSDITKPEIEEILTIDSRSNSFGLYSGMSTTIELTYCENIDYKCVQRTAKGESSRSFLLGRLTNQKGEYHYVKIIDSQFQIYEGSCSRTFDLDYGTKYFFTLQLLDLSGNFSTEITDFEMRTAQYEKVEYEEFERNGIKGDRICK